MKKAVMIIVGVLLCFTMVGAKSRINFCVPPVEYTAEEDKADTHIDVSNQLAYLTGIEMSIGRYMRFTPTKYYSYYSTLLQRIEETKDAYIALSKYTYAEWRMLAVTTDYEAGGCTQEHKEYVCQVLLNRCSDPRFDDNIYDNLMRPMQYNPLYTYASEGVLRESLDPKQWQSSLNAAKAAMMGLVDMPSDVIYQSEFPKLGKGTWKSIWVESVRTTTYFNYG